jgi:hypothetical protein
MIRTRSLLALSVIALAAPGSASADPQPTPSARLVVTRGAGASSCPTDDEIRNAVSGRLGYDPFQADAQRLVSATIARDRRGLTVTVSVHDEAGRAAGSRQLSSAQNDCSELASAMTLAISIAIDPLAFTRPAPAPPPPPPPPSPPAPPPVEASPPPAPPPEPPLAPVVVQPEATAAPPPAPPDVSAPERAPTREWAFRASVGTIASIGAAPHVGWGITTQLGIRMRALSVGIEGRGDLPVSGETQGSSGVETILLLATLVPCAHYRFLSGCGLGSVGALHGRGFGVDRPLSQTTPYAAAGARLAAEFAAGQNVLMRGSVDLLATLTPTTLLLNGAPAWVTPRASGALGVALVRNFP